MNRQGRILIVEDLEKWRDEVGASLRRAGFHVDAVASTAEALARMEGDFYHLMVLDIRMEESEPENEEGMELLRKLNEHGEAMQIMVLSGHSTPEQMREAFRDFDVADFIVKENFNNDVFAAQVSETLSKSRTKLDLKIHWEPETGLADSVINLSLGSSRVKRDTALQKLVAEELDDLLCRLFFQADSLLVRPLAPGTSGAGVLWVQPFYQTGAGRSVVVKFGDVEKIEKEYANFLEYVQPFVGGGRCTTVLALRRTLHLGGIEYSLLGAADDHIEDFDVFYCRSDIDEIRPVLDRLFTHTCGDWYANLGKLMPHDLTDDYQALLALSLERLEKTLPENLKSVQGKRDLHFKSLSGNASFSNPILALGSHHLRRPTYVCTTHGDFSEHNILVDSTGQTWLIDFLRTGRGHVLRDVAQLDSVVRLHLLAAEDASLDERLEMEKALCGIERFSQVEQLSSGFTTDNKALAKTFATVVHLRTIARRLVAQNPRDEINEYYIALLYYALNTIRFMEALRTVQREHALLCASLLADRLGL